MQSYGHRKIFPLQQLLRIFIRHERSYAHDTDHALMRGPLCVMQEARDRKDDDARPPPQLPSPAGLVPSPFPPPIHAAMCWAASCGTSYEM